MSEYLPPVVGQLTGDITDLLGKLEEAEAALEDFASKRYVATVNLTISDVLAKADEAQNAIDSIDGTDVPVMADNSDLLFKVAEAQEALNALAGTDIPLDANPAPALAAIAEVAAAEKALTEDDLLSWDAIGVHALNTMEAILNSETATRRAVQSIPIEFETSAAFADMAILQAMELKLEEPILLDMDISKAEAEIAAIKAELATLQAESAISIGAKALAGAAGGDAGGAAGGGGGGSFLGTLLGSAFPGNGGRGKFNNAVGFGKPLLPKIPIAGFGTLGSLAGLGPESLLGLGAGVVGSAAHAALGGAALGATSLGVAGVGMATDYTGMGQAAKDAKTYETQLNTLNRAIAVYGQGSVQAAAAQYDLNQTVKNFTPAETAAISSLAAAGSAIHAAFDQATAAAETKGAGIIQSLMQTATAFLPTIGQFASQNMSIIQSALQPLQTWLVGPGLQAFTVLEQTFQDHLPTAMHAFDQGVELVLKTMAHFAPQTGGLITWLDNLFTRLNGPGFDKFMGEIQNAIGAFHVWEGFLKSVGDAIYELFHNDAGTGQAFIQTLTDLINRFNDWAKTVAGGDKLHEYMAAHKQEVLSLVQGLGNLIGAFGELHLTVGPTLMTIVTGFVDLANAILKIPGIGWIASYGLALAALGSHFRPLGALLSLLTSGLQALAEKGLNLLGGAISALGGPFSKLGGWLQGIGKTGPTTAEQMQAAAVAMQAAADTMTEAGAQLATAAEGVGTAFTNMAAQASAATTGVDLSADTMAANVDTDMTNVSLATDAMAADVNVAATDAEAGFARIEAGAGEAGAAGALSDGEVAAEGMAGGMSGLIGPAGVAALAVGGLVIGAQKLGAAINSWMGGDTAVNSLKAVVAATQNLPADNIQAMAVSLDQLNKAMNAQTGQSNTVAQNMAELKNVSTGGFGSTIPQAAQLYQEYQLLTQGSSQMSKNIDELSKKFGVNQSTATSLAASLGINLTKAMDPTDVKQFGAAVKQQGDNASGAGTKTSAMGDQVKTAGDKAKTPKDTFSALAQTFGNLATAAQQAPQVGANIAAVTQALDVFQAKAPGLRLAIGMVEADFSGMAKNSALQRVSTMFGTLSQMLGSIGTAATSAGSITSAGVASIIAALQTLAANAPTIEQAILQIILSFQAIGNMKQAQANIASVSSMISSLSSVFQAFGAMMPNVVSMSVPAIGSIVTSLQNLASNMPGITEAINSIVAQLGTLGNLQQAESQLSSLEQLFSSLDTIFGDVASAAADAAQVTPDSLSQIQTAFQNLGTAITNLGTTITQATPTAQASIQSMANSLTSYLNNTTVPQMFSVGGSLMSGLAQGIAAGAQQAINAAEAVAVAVELIIRAALATRSPSQVFHNIGLDIMAGLANGMTAGFTSAVMPVLNKAAGAIVSVGMGLFGSTLSGNQVAASNITSVVQTATATQVQTTSAVTTVLQQVVAALHSLQGILQTLQSGIATMVSAMASLGATMTAAAHSITTTLSQYTTSTAQSLAANTAAINAGGPDLRQMVTDPGWPGAAANTAAYGPPLSWYSSITPVPGLAGTPIPNLLTNPPQTPVINGAASSSAAIPSSVVLQVTTPIQIDGKTIATTTTKYQLRSGRGTGTVLGQYSGSSQNGSATSFNTNAIQR